MMKKINSIRQLETEKARMKQRQAELEKKIQGNWKELKDAVRPSALAREAWDKIIESKIETNLNKTNIVKSAIAYGITLLAKKITTSAEEKLNKLFK